MVLDFLRFWYFGGFKGKVFERKPDCSIGTPIAGVKILFTSEDGIVKSVISDSDGSYNIRLSRGRYKVKASHPNYEEYTSSPGYFVVQGFRYHIGNIFMQKRDDSQTTTFFVVRHSDYDRGYGQNPSLNSAGQIRAQNLAEVLCKANVDSIYSTNFNRTMETGQPLANAKNIAIQFYNDVIPLVNQVKMNHLGEKVLIIAHSNTVPEIIDKLTNKNHGILIGDNEFQNLYVVIILENKSKVLNLQYGVNLNCSD